MFRYLLAFAIMNSYYQSLGVPISPDSHLLVKSLANLANECENKLLSAQINSTVNLCANMSQKTSFNKKQLQCLMFYDINKQLCTAIGESKIVVTEDFAAKIQEKQDVDALCTEAKGWTFSNLPDYTTYTTQAEILKRPAACGEICGRDDADADMFQANYFCKYFKWGFELLKSQQFTSVSGVNDNIIPESDEKAKTDIAVGVNNLVNTNPEKSNVPNEETKVTDVAVSKSTPTGVVLAAGLNDSGDLKFDKSTKETVHMTTKQAIGEDKSNLDLNIGQEDPTLPDNKGMQGQTNANDQTKKSSPGENILDGNVGNVLIQPPGLDAAPKADGVQQGGQVDDEYHEDSEGNDMDDTGLEDTDALEPMPKQETQQNINSIKQNILPSNNDIPRDGYNSMTDSFNDDGDHFIPFFLTAVILVVFLYVLYHNKSKVSKVFFGLVLEGRQGGRRRNSRGHAYRRLDTLEQAMSTNTSAPPSKIIY